MNDPFEVRDRLKVDFLRAELHTGLTFARIALSANYDEKIERNRVNARKAYDSYRDHLPGTPLSDAELQEFNERRAELEGLLVKLGESIEN